MRLSLWSPDLDDARRDYIVHILRTDGGAVHMTTLASVLCEIDGVPLPERLKGNPALFHNSKYRRIITEDIREISMSDQWPRAYIIHDNHGVKLGTKEELAGYAERRHKEAVKILHEMKVVLKKANLEENERFAI